MKNTFSYSSFLLAVIVWFASFSILANAEELKNRHVIISHALVAATPPGVKNAAVYLTITNNLDKDVSIISANSDVSDVTELHEHSMIDGAMSMRQVQTVDLPVKKKVLFQPGGLHIMLFGLKHPLTTGNRLNLSLTLSNGEMVNTEVIILMPDDLANQMTNINQ